MSNVANSSNYIENNVTYRKLMENNINPQDIPVEQFCVLAQTLEVSQEALEKIFKILKQEEVAFYDYDHALQQIIERYHNLLAELAAFQTDEPEVKTLITEAEKALEQGKFEQTEVLINQASDKDLQAAQQMQKNADKQLFSAASPWT